MGYWRISADELARSRFAISALAQTVVSLITLAGGEAGPGRQTWARRYRPAYQQRLANDPVAAAFVDAALRPRWVADFIAVPPGPGDRTFHDELRQIRQTPADVVRNDLTVNGRLTPVLGATDVVERCADLLEWVWTQTVRPEWPRLVRLFEADILARTQRLGSEGWAAALDDLRPGTRWLGDGRLQINAHDNPPRDLSGADLLFIPSTARRGWAAWRVPTRYALVYPCRGILAETATPADPGALARLIGPNRAAILTALADPLSTSQLVALTGYGLGSVGGHLKVLLDADLIARRRAGRSVVYTRTALGDRLAG
jgi:DNA-binding transcriptional ArsR family regulator